MTEHKVLYKYTDGGKKRQITLWLNGTQTTDERFWSWVETMQGWGMIGNEITLKSIIVK